MGTDKEMKKALLETEQKLMIERDIMEKKLLKGQNEKMKEAELINLKLKMLSEQQGSNNQKVLELHKLKTKVIVTG